MVSALLALTACDVFEQEPIEGFRPKLMVAAYTWPTTDVVFIGDTEEEKNVVIEERVDTTDPGDIAISAFGDNYYRLGRDTYDNITQVKLDESSSVLSLGWQYSVNGTETGANPYGMAFLNEKQAYLSRAGSDNLWLVNLDATTEDQFYEHEIDLSSYSASGASNPRMGDMELVGNKLFVVLTRLTGFDVNENSSVVVINTSNNQVIRNIELPGANASEISYLNGKVYIVASGKEYGGTVEEYSGGIFSIDINTYAVDTVLEDGEEGNAPYGHLVDMHIDLDGNIYFVGRAGWGDDSLFVIEADKPTFAASEIDLGEGAFNIGDVTSDYSKLYVGVHAQTAEPFTGAGIKEINRFRYEEKSHIETVYNPIQIIVLD